MQTSLARTIFGITLLPVLGGLIGFQLSKPSECTVECDIQSGRYDKQIEDRVLPILQSRFEHDNPWFGIQMLQFPEDLMLYQRLLHETKPDIVIETGTFNGGLSLYLASLLQVINPQGKIVTVDLDPAGWNKTLSQFTLPGKQSLLDRIVFLEGSSTDPDIVATVKEHVGKNKRVLVILDALHTKEHVLAELKAYAPLVSPDSFIIVNDTQLDGKKTRFGETCGVTEALQEWSPTNSDFVADASWNRFLASCCHHGIFKRVR